MRIDELPIVLTATIIPNVPGAASVDPASRLAEYLQVLQFCQRIAPVIFLENSGYPLERHAEFAASPRLRIHRFAPSANPERGKGYQEFEMIDAWLAREPQPPGRWFKLTGRYQLRNLAALLAECRQETAPPLLIDRLQKQQFARTHFFSTTTEFYQRRIKGLYLQCDDRKKEWIEYVLFRELEKAPAHEVRIFKTQPDFNAKLGSTGANLPSGSFQWLAKQGLRRFNYLVNRQKLLYVR